MAFERIVIGIDFSAASVEAARWAAAHLAPRSEVVLAHIIASGGQGQLDGSRRPRPDFLVDTARDRAEQKLREIGLTLNAEFVWREVRDGHPEACLIEIADEFSADLLVVAAYGEHADSLEELGSTAERVARLSSRPVLVVAQPRGAPPSRLLIPIQEPDDTPAALKCAGEISHQSRAMLSTLHVVWGGVPGEREAWEVGDGDVTREILGVIRRGRADLVVIGRRDDARPALGGLVEVLRHAICPVLVVPESPARAVALASDDAQPFARPFPPAAARSDRNSDTFSAVSTPTSS